jgi:DNA invertase Pin-like site-specific DNA recombinase
LAEKLGHEVVVEFEDVITGGTSDRPAFNAMFEAAARKEFELVLFWSLDRLSSEGTEATLRHLRILRENGVGYKSHEEAYLDTTNPLNEVFISFKAVMAVEEKKRISQRTKAGLAQAKLRGVVLGNHPVEVDTNRMKELRAQGLPIRKIANILGVGSMTVCRRLQELQGVTA